MPVPPSMSDACSDARPSSGCVRVGSSSRVDAIELGEQQAGVANRVDADVPAAAVRRAAGDVHLDPDEAAVRRHDREARRLGDDRRVGAHAALDQRARAEALVLLVGHGGDDDLAGDAPSSRRARAPRRTSPRRPPFMSAEPRP